MKHLVMFGCVVISFSAISPLRATGLAVPDKSVTVAEGNFVFSRMALGQSYGQVELTGFVANKTTKNWNQLSFVLRITAAGGDSRDSSLLLAETNLDSGGSTSFRSLNLLVPPGGAR